MNEFEVCSKRGQGRVEAMEPVQAAEEAKIELSELKETPIAVEAIAMK